VNGAVYATRASRLLILSGVLALGALAGACGGDAPARTSAARTADGACAQPAGDSARAVCAALDTVAKMSGQPARVLRLSRQGEHTCVLTVPSDPAVTDGMGAVVVGPRGRIVSAVVTDSAGCPPRLGGAESGQGVNHEGD